MKFELGFVKKLENRLNEKNTLIQVVLGPRQVGKTTGVKQLIQRSKRPTFYASADKTIATPSLWIKEQWLAAKNLGEGTILFIDEIQKIENWSELVKSLWDNDNQNPKMNLVLLGSSSLQLQKGLTESLAGRFELIKVFHWNFLETKNAFACDLDSYLDYGGYPGAMKYVADYERWYLYIKESIVEAVIGKDILDSAIVERPSLFRQAFELLCSYPAQEISYTKLLGQLQDKGNTDLVKRYISLFQGAFLLKSLEKFSSKAIKVKSSSPKILPLCPSLVSLQLGKNLSKNNEIKGRLFELVVGAELNRLTGSLYYWRDGKYEVDYIYKEGSSVYAVEVKTARKRSLKGLKEFVKRFKYAVPVIVSYDNYEDFFKNPLDFMSLGS